MLTGKPLVSAATLPETTRNLLDRESIANHSECSEPSNESVTSEKNETSFVRATSDNVEHRPTIEYHCVCAAPTHPLAAQAYQTLLKQLVDLLKDD
jgi:hypothetical protein